MPIYRTDEELEEVGRSFLRRLGLEGQVRPDPMTVIGKIKHNDPRFNYRRVSDRMMPDAEARWDSDKCEVAMRESIFTGMQRGEAHARFVVFHEISHYVLGHQGTRNRAATAKTRSYSVGTIRHEEGEASRLAAIIMAPEHLVPENKSAYDLADLFGMSEKAAIIRKEDVDRIRRQRRGELRPLPESVKELLRNAKDKGFPIQTRLDD
ncbi:ImmA/IrrE family metallo-endopeptidase [Bradyrhizobium oligotrophicum]|uniref:ImmA/IrrE family metallo-endopeptidase n=1 Tax=Bradyrhizobium oligotrophicum TaxID=44255 RepID=UPI003EB6ACBC